jgi:hypothetical protein
MLFNREHEFVFAQNTQFACESWHAKFWLHVLQEIGQ